jgi:hypothetical protein
MLIAIPQGAKLGNYPATLTIRFGDCIKIYNIVIALKDVPVATSKSEDEISLCAGEPLYLFVETDINENYQWYLDGELIQGATGNVYQTLFDDAKAGVYTVEISNECGMITYSFNVHLNPLTIKRKWDDVLYVDNSGDKYVRYQWYKNGQPISKDGDAQYYTEYDNNGCFTPHAEYNVKAYKADGTFDEACAIVPNPGTCEGAAELLIYPNPATSGTIITFQLNLPNGEKPDATAYIYDMIGKLVAAYKITDYHTQVEVHFAAGMYMVKVDTTSGLEFIEKIIIQK